MGSDGSVNCLDFGNKVFVANTTLKKDNCLVNGIGVSSVDISFEFVYSDKDFSSELLYQDLDTVSFFEKDCFFNFNVNLERDFILSEDVANIMEEEALVDLDNMLSVTNESSSCLYHITDMHSASKFLECFGSISSVDDLALVCGDRNDRLEKMNSGSELVEPSDCLGEKLFVDQVENGGFSDKFVRDDSLYNSNDSLKVATVYNKCCAIDKTNVTVASNTYCIIDNATIVSTSSLRKASVCSSGSFSASCSSRIRCCSPQSSKMRSVSEMHHGDISTEEAFVCIDKMLNVRKEMSLCVLALDVADNQEGVGGVLNEIVVSEDSFEESAIGDGNVRILWL